MVYLPSVMAPPTFPEPEDDEDDEDEELLAAPERQI